jgi:hypothetical protein
MTPLFSPWPHFSLGKRFNVRDTAISEESRRFAKELESDGKLRGMVDRIKGKLKTCST